MEKNWAPTSASKDSWILGRDYASPTVFVEPAVVHTEADASIFLADYDHWCSIRTVAFDDDLL